MAGSSFARIAASAVGGFYCGLKPPVGNGELFRGRRSCDVVVLAVENETHAAGNPLGVDAHRSIADCGGELSVVHAQLDFLDSAADLDSELAAHKLLSLLACHGLTAGLQQCVCWRNPAAAPYLSAVKRWIATPALVFTLASSFLAVLAIAFVPEAARAERGHTVRSGQTLAQIAKRYRVSVTELRAANRMGRSSRLRPGQRLVVPDRFEAYVRPGDTLSHLARRHDISIAELRRLNRLRRNARLRVGQRLVLPGFVPAADETRDWGQPTEAGTVTVVRRGDSRRMKLVDASGRVLREGLESLAAAMRRREDDPLRPANPRLAILLARISDHFGGRPITIVSGFRAAGGYTRETSRHTKGRATDIRIRGVRNRTLWEYCRRLGNAGCGFYPRSTFVHVDVRRLRTQWVDWSRPGRRPRYGTLRGPARRGRRRNMQRPRQHGEIPMQVDIMDASGGIENYDDEAMEAIETPAEEVAASTRLQEAPPQRHHPTTQRYFKP